MPPSVSASRQEGPLRRTVLGAGILALFVAAVYWNSLTAPFIFDDIPAVERNPTIRHLWPPWMPLNPPVNGSGASGRPLMNLSLAVNYALGGLDVRGYHAMNLALHAMAVLVLWGVLRRTLRQLAAGGGRVGNLANGPIPDGPDGAAGPQPEMGRGSSPPRPSSSAVGKRPARPISHPELLAWIIALLWAVHPLLTESVVCVVQRNEVLGSLFYLLTLYCFIRGAAAGPPTGDSQGAADASSGRNWLMLSVLACLAGVASKEIVATAPLLVLLYDRTFVAGTFRSAWLRRWRYYGTLAATWLPLAWWVWRNQARGGTVGFGLTIDSWHYLLTQCDALALYLKLSFWPHPLVLDYGWPAAAGVGAVWWQAILVVGVLAATVVALVRRPAVGFVGAWFFVILAPSSSLVPLATQTIAEHRMYLALAAPLTAAMVGAAAWLGRRTLAFGAALALALGGLTVARNRAYRSELAIWTDTVAKCPGNARAQGNLGRAYLELGRWTDAIAACRKELELAPSYNGDARANLGRALTELGRADEALPYFEAALRLRPGSFDVHNNFGIALAALGRWPEALAQYEIALRERPDDAELHNNYANALDKVGRLPEALANYAVAVRLEPGLVNAEVNWGRSLAEAGRLTEALPHLERALDLRPDAAAHTDLANALAAAGRTAEAVPQYEAALRLGSDNALVHVGLGNAFARLGRIPDAIAQYAAAVRRQPSLADAQHNLAIALMREGRPAEALPHLEATARLLPDSADTHHDLAMALGELHRWGEAAREEVAALRLRPDFPEARGHLEWLRRQSGN